MSQSYTNYFTYATSRPTPLQIAYWSGKYALEIRGERLEVRGEIGEIGGVGAIRAIGRVTFVGMHGTYNRCRDARQTALIKRTSQEVRCIVAVGRRGYSPERPMDRRTW